MEQKKANKTKNYCKDCGKRIRRTSKRCKKCDIQFRKKNGKKYFCLDCGKQVWRDSLRCKSCAHKHIKHSEKTKEKIRKKRIGNKNPFYGRHHSKKTKKRLRKANSGQNHPQWKGGEFIKKSGYKYIHKPNHPCSTKGGYVLEHRLVMEKYLKRFLKPTEVVHHINGDTLDNGIENLWLFSSNSKHIIAEQSLKKLIKSFLKKKLIYFNKKEAIYKLK